MLKQHRPPPPQLPPPPHLPRARPAIIALFRPQARHARRAPRGRLVRRVAIHAHGALLLSALRNPRRLHAPQALVPQLPRHPRAEALRTPVVLVRRKPRFLHTGVAHLLPRGVFGQLPAPDALLVPVRVLEAGQTPVKRYGPARAVGAPTARRLGPGLAAAAQRLLARLADPEVVGIEAAEAAGRRAALRTLAAGGARGLAAAGDAGEAGGDVWGPGAPHGGAQCADCTGLVAQHAVEAPRKGYAIEWGVNVGGFVQV